MKNKRKCKNKYRQNKPEEDINKEKTSDEQEPKEVKINSQDSKSNSENISQPVVQNKKNERQAKPLKRKNPDEKWQKEEKITKSDQTEKSSPESCRYGSKWKAGELQVEITKDPQILTKTQKPELTKEQSLKRQKLRKMLSSHETDQHESPAEQKDAGAEKEPEKELKQSCPDSFRARMEQRLESARFRYINEVLYTTTSGEAKRMFQQDPQAFWVYHKGYTAQVQRWPANPVDAIISYICKK